MSYGRGKRDNEYAQLVFHVDAPKTVWMALAVSYAAKANDLILTTEDMTDAMMKEWTTLHQNGIVPQPPRQNRHVS